MQQFLPLEMRYCELSMCVFYDVIVKILSESQKRLKLSKSSGTAKDDGDFCRRLSVFCISES